MIKLEMKKAPLYLLPLAMLIAAGCHNESSGSPSSTTDTGVASKKPDGDLTKQGDGKTTPSDNVATGSSTPALSTSPGASASTPPAPSPASVPASLKHEGFEYAGVERSSPIDMELVMSKNPGAITTGSQTITLKESKDGQVVYSIDRTGGLSNLGTEEWTINKEGVFTTKSSVMDIGEKAMELPADPKPGMKWSFHTKASQPGVDMDMTITSKIIGTQSVRTKAGKFDKALLVEQDGVGTLQNDKIRTVSQNWYVKGLGLVKASMKTYLPKGKTESLSIEETKTK